MPVSYGELMQNRYGSGAGNGWGSLGAALMGNGARRDAAMMQGAYQGARMRDALAQERMRVAQAVKAEAENDARIRYVGNLKDSGVDPMTAAFLGANFSAGYNPNIASEAQIGQGKLAAQHSALDAAMRGDDIGMNRQIAVGDMKPLQVTHVADNVSFNPYADATGQTMTPTDLGRAMIGEKNAQASASNALAAKRGMGVGLPQKPAVKPTTLTKDEAARLFPDDQDYRNFQQFRYQGIQSGHPEYANADHAAMAYADAHKFDDVDSTLGAPPPEPSMLGRVLGAFSGSSPAPQSAPQAPTQVAASPYKEGQKLRGPDGKTYVVQNGQPVPL